MSTRGVGDDGVDDGDDVEPEPPPGAAADVVDDGAEAAADVDEDAAAEVDELLLEPAASRAACAATRFAWATVTARVRSSVSIVASTSPASTSSPTTTFTDVTVPAVRNAAVTWSTRSTDPDSEVDWVTEPVATVAVRMPDVAAWLGSASTTR